MEIEIIAEDSYIIDWDLLDNNSIFHLDSTKVLTRQFRQSVDDYTAILESEVNDVVDRTNTSKINYLSVRSEDYVINDDNQVLILPTRVERVVKLEINFSKYGYFIGDVTSYVDYSRIGTNIGKFSKFVLEEDCESAGDFAANTWASFFPKETRDYYNNICKYLKQHHPLMYNSNWLFGGSYDENVGKTSYFFVWSETQSGIKTFDLSEIIIEKNQYDLLETLEKTKYCYYTYNDDVIRGIYEYTHDDFWGSIMLDKKHPMLYYVLNSALKREIEVIEGELLFYIGLPYDFNKMTFTSLSINPRDYTFNIEYIPISSLYLLSENNKTSFNFEYEIKPTSRSFELSSSMSDFDLLVDSINKNNKMLGMPECSIQYFGKDYPKPSNLIDVAGIYHYVSSVQTTITFDKYVSVVNLVKEYNKIAEVFGVKTQFESTKLPLNNIIDRIVYCGEFNVTNGNVNGFQLIDFNYGRFNLFKQGVLFEKDECTYLVVEAVDNYCFDFQNNNNANLNDKVTENKQIPYADTNNECESFYIRAGFLNSNISLANSKSLPKYDSTYITLNGSTQKIIVYKDARERLIFVGKLKY